MGLATGIEPGRRSGPSLIANLLLVQSLKFCKRQPFSIRLAWFGE